MSSRRSAEPQLRHDRLAELRPLRLRRRRLRHRPEPVPPGSAQIEQVFNDYFDSQGLATEPTAFDGRSDYGPFIDAGIPAGGLFTGAEGIKTAAQAATYGGTAGAAYDPCYHQACDTINNLNETGFDQMSDAAATALTQLALLQGPLASVARAQALAHTGVQSDYRGSLLCGRSQEEKAEL